MIKATHKVALLINSLAFLGLLILFCVAYQFIHPSEDAVILYEYAKNLAQKGVITYGNASVPIEGATDFLFMVCIAFFKKLGITEFASSLMLNFLGACSIAYLARRFGVPIILTLLGIIATPYLYSSLFGFSTLFFAAVYVFALCLVLEEKAECYLAILLLCLVRLDGVVWGFGLVLLRFYLVQNKSELKNELIKCLLYLIIPGLLFFAWRSWYFNEWFPLPFLVKSSGHRDLFIFFSESLVMLKYPLVPIVLTALCTRPPGYVQKSCLLFFFVVFFYSVVRLEQDVGNRFLAPIFFGALILSTSAKSTKVTAFFIIISIIVSFRVTVNTFNTVLDSNNNNIFSLSQDLSQLHGNMLATEAGVLAYYSNWNVQDSWGLNTPKYAHSLISRNQIEQGSYDLINAHCTISMLADTASGTPEIDERTWDNQCRVLTSYISSGHYTVYLVPFFKGEFLSQQLKEKIGYPVRTQKCKRYDMYAISQKYKEFNKLQKIITDHGGILYKGDFKGYVEDSICN